MECPAGLSTRRSRGWSCWALGALALWALVLQTACATGLAAEARPDAPREDMPAAEAGAEDLERNAEEVSVAEGDRGAGRPRHMARRASKVDEREAQEGKGVGWPDGVTCEPRGPNYHKGSVPHSPLFPSPSVPSRPLSRMPLQALQVPRWARFRSPRWPKSAPGLPSFLTPPRSRPVDGVGGRLKCTGRPPGHGGNSRLRGDAHVPGKI